MSTTEFLNTDPFEAARTAADYIASETGVAAHDTALVLGSGWAEAADHQPLGAGLAAVQGAFLVPARVRAR